MKCSIGNRAALIGFIGRGDSIIWPMVCDQKTHYRISRLLTSSESTSVEQVDGMYWITYVGKEGTKKPVCCTWVVQALEARIARQEIKVQRLKRKNKIRGRGALLTLSLIWKSMPNAYTRTHYLCVTPFSGP